LVPDHTAFEAAGACCGAALVVWLFLGTFSGGRGGCWGCCLGALGGGAAEADGGE